MTNFSNPHFENTDPNNFSAGYEEALARIDKEYFHVEGEFDVERGYIWTSVASVENGNPIYWDDEIAEQITHGIIAPPTLMSAWFRPHHWVPNREKVPLPWSTHFWLKENLQVPEAIATDSEVILGQPIRLGDRIRTHEVLRSVGDVKTTKLGKGRFWKIDAICTNQKGEWVGTETMTGFGYRNHSMFDSTLSSKGGH